MRTETKTLRRFAGSILLRRVFLVILSLVMVISPQALAQIIAFEDNWGHPGFNLIHQDAGGVEIVFSLSSMEISNIMINGERMQSVSIPGVTLPNDAGAPDLPGLGSLIALPQGARAELEVVECRAEAFRGMNIAPAFSIPYQNDYRPLKYEKNPEIYNLDAYYPVDAVMLGEPARMRGVDVVAVGITPFQYNPVSKDLLVYRDIRLRIHFVGGRGHFGEDRLRSRWWEPVLRQNLLNYASLPEVNVHRPPQCDEDDVEYIIIVPDDPAFIAWADSLKRWRNEQGIYTGITTLAEIGGNIATLIEDYIDNAYWSWTIPPVAVLLLSDYQQSGDQYGITAPIWNGYCASDNIYADVDGDNLPDLVMARITAQNSSQLQQMITKQLNYERNPCTDPGFYQNPVTSGGWLETSWFILCCETVWGYFHTVHGKDPVREYAIISGTPGSVWSTAPGTQDLVNYFGPNGLGYIPEDPSYLTDWGGNAQRINDDINQGSFMILHRDYGSETGWGTPSYTINDLSGLSNEAPPYVFSIDCLTGKFNSSNTCFAEAFHRMQHGALGVLAASEMTYSFINDHFFWYVFDSMWPDFMPDVPSNPIGEPILMPGFANANAKWSLAICTWPYNPQQKATTYHLFHHHGDAFLTLYSEVPQNLTVDHADYILPGATAFTVTADSGALIGLSVNGGIVGVAEATGAPLPIPITPPGAGDILRVTVTKANYFRYIADVPAIPSVAITLIPYNPPIQIPATGGRFDFNIAVANNSDTTMTFDVWCDVRLPDSTIIGPLFGPINVTVPAGFSGDRDRSQNVPGGAPPGSYSYNGYVGVYPDDIWNQSSFTFEKLGADESDWESGWFNTGESFGGKGDSRIAPTGVPETYSLEQNYPNPFNPVTTIRYGLPEDAFVKIAIYDLLSRQVAELVNGWREAGAHEVTFDGSDLPSGIYFCRLSIGDVSQYQKLILMK